MAKKTVFITGGTGNMGWAAVQEMLKKPSEINIKMLARKSPKNEEKLKGLMAKPNVKVVWGDLCDYDAILEGVTGADYVLHIGGMVSPTADWNLTERRNQYRRCAEHLQGRAGTAQCRRY